MPTTTLRGALRRLADRGPAGRQLVETVRQHLDPHGGAVAVVGPPGSSRLVATLSAALPGTRVRHLTWPAADPEQAHTALAALGWLDVVVDDTGSTGRHLEVFRRTFGHLRPGGVLVARDATAHARPGLDTDRAMAEAVADVREAGPHVVVTKRTRTWAKIREEHVNRMLSAPGRPQGEVLTALPPAILRSRASFGDSPGRSDQGLPDSIEVPELSLRRYDGVECHEGQIVRQGNLLLPDSFRHNQQRRLRHRYLRWAGPGFARPAGPRTGPPTRLEGAYFHLDSEFRGHFGHALTEQLSRLWAWQQAKELEPELKALLLTSRHPQLRAFEIALYGAAGIDADDLVLVPGPVEVDRLYCATPMFSQPAYAHPGLDAIWSRVGAALDAQAGDRPYPERVFCSRRGARRGCHNASEVESLFADAGFTAVFPERLPLADQARMFRSAAVVAGFAGSAMLSAIFAEPAQRLIAVSSSSYRAKNLHLIAAVRGHRLDTAWCRPDVQHPDGGWCADAFQSSYTFDADVEGVWLRQLLDGL